MHCVSCATKLPPRKQNFNNVATLTVLFSERRGTGQAGAYNRPSVAGCRRDTASPVCHTCAAGSSEHHEAFTPPLVYSHYSVNQSLFAK